MRSEPPQAFEPSASTAAAAASDPPATVKLHATVVPSSNTFNAYGDGYVEVNGVRHEGSLIVLPDRPVIAWSATGFTGLTDEDFRRVAEEAPELVVFGSGATLRFVHPRLLLPLIERGIGVETMDVHAACRTYNILMAEGRRVAAALLIEPTAAPPTASPPETAA